MSHTVLHALSGGIDSTSVLIKLLNAGELPLLYHMDLERVRVKAERAAVTGIIAWCQQKYGVELRCHYSAGSGLHGVWDIEMAALVAGGLLRRYEAINKTTASSSYDDTILSNWQNRHDSRVRITESMANRQLQWLMPNRGLRRREVVGQLPLDLVAVCSWCRRPTQDERKYCGSCYACQQTVPFLSSVKGPESCPSSLKRPSSSQPGPRRFTTSSGS